MRKLIDEIHDRTLAILSEHKSEFEEVAKELIEREMIMASDLERILGPKAGVHGQERLAAGSEKDTETKQETEVEAE